MHCIAMCGPLILALPIGKYSIKLQYIYIFFYHLGRLLIYISLGIILSLFGNSLWTLGLFNLFSVILGSLILLWNLLQFFKIPWNFTDKISFFVSKKISKLLSGKRTFFTFFILGSLNGLLPCGLVYTALSSSFLYHTTIEILLLMLGFGLATIPLLITLNMFKNSIPAFLKNKWNLIQKIIMILISILLIARGLNVKIPILNPTTKPEQIECH